MTKAGNTPSGRLQRDVAVENPYASPGRSGLAREIVESDILQRWLSYCLPAEGIWAEFRLLPGELRQALHHYSGTHQQAVRILAVLALLSAINALAVFNADLAGWSLLFLLGLATGVYAGAACLTLINIGSVAAAARRLPRKLEQEVLTAVTRDGVVSAAGGSISVRAWRAFRWFSADDRMIVLATPPYHVLPLLRRGSSSDEDWWRLRALVEQHVPRKRWSKIDHCPASPFAVELPRLDPAVAERLAQLLDRAPLAVADALRGHGDVSVAELAAAWAMGSPGKAWHPNVQAACFAAAAGLLLLAAARLGGASAPAVALQGICCGAAILLLVSAFQSIGIRRRRIGALQPLLDNVLAATGDRLQLATADTCSIMPWSAFSGRRLLDDRLALELDAHFTVIPRRWFADQEQWAAFLRLVEGRVPDSS